jgi:PAS domain S-box-containing protein
MEPHKDTVESGGLSLRGDRCVLSFDSEVGQAILESLPLGLLVAGSETGTILFANRTAERILCSSFVSFGGDSAAGGPLSSYQDGIPYPAKEWPLAQVLNGATVRDQVVHYVRGDGISRILRVSGTPLRGTGGRVIGAIMIFNDVTDAEFYKIALRESEERFHVLSMGTLVGVAITSGTVLDVNEKFCVMFGYDRTEAVGMLPPQFHPPEERELIAHMNGACDPTPYEAVCLRKDGTRFLAQIHGQAMPYKGRRVRVTAFREVIPLQQRRGTPRTCSCGLAENVDARTPDSAKLTGALCEHIDPRELDHAAVAPQLRVMELEKEVVRLTEELAKHEGRGASNVLKGVALGARQDVDLGAER